MIRMHEKRIPRNAARRRDAIPEGSRRWITVGETASLLSLHPMSVRKMIARGKIPAVRLGRAVRVDLRALEAGLERQVAGLDK
jgi:excisionase family DNA binding protein